MYDRLQIRQRVSHASFSLIFPAMAFSGRAQGAVPRLRGVRGSALCQGVIYGHSTILTTLPCMHAYPLEDRIEGHGDKDLESIMAFQDGFATLGFRILA